MAEIKIGGKTRFENLLKQLLFTPVGYEVIITNSRYALVGYFITSYLTRAHGIIVMYFQGNTHTYSNFTGNGEPQKARALQEIV